MRDFKIKLKFKVIKRTGIIPGRPLTAALLSTDGLDGRALIYGRAGRLCALVKFKILCDRSLEVPSTMASALVVGV